jgi:hypothetical protein
VICVFTKKSSVLVGIGFFFALYALPELPQHFTFRSYKDGKIEATHIGGPVDEQASQSSYYGR